ncbi:MAG: tellurite resistance TerB family protein [Pseudomonadota bacterium]
MSAYSPHQAMIHIMVTMSAADRTMTDQELSKIGNIVKSLPFFDGYDPENLIKDARECSQILQATNGLGDVISNALDVLPEDMHETIYALAVDVAAADLVVEQEELRLLQILRDSLTVDKLVCAAIERGARARHRAL